jgi:pilus assembly protein CpaD
MTARTSQALSRGLRMAGTLLGIAVALGACTYTYTEELVTAGVPDDYRLRHPIAIQEGSKSIVVFIGHGRGGLTAEQRADVWGMGLTWVHEATGAITIDVPVNSSNSRPAADALREIRSLLSSVGVPPHGVVVHHYRPDDPRFLPPIRLTYAKISAVAGPCGVWPEDLGPSIHDRSYSENKPYYNFGCASQRNLAAMVENPSDLVQPRPETPAYTMRRNIAFDKYRKGTATTTTYPEADKAKLSDLGR